jgi:ankyrin repeat protein
LLLDEGVCANVTNIYGETSLHLAALYGNLSATKALVKWGTALEEPNEVGRTPLMLAALGGQLEVVRYLVKNGAGVNVCSAVESALLLATDETKLDVMRFLLEQGADINGSNVERGMSPLQVAVLKENTEIVKCLIERGADVSYNIPGSCYISALELAKHSGKSEIMGCFTKAGYNFEL